LNVQKANQPTFDGRPQQQQDFSRLALENRREGARTSYNNHSGWLVAYRNSA